MKLSGLTILMIGISIFLVAIGFAYFQHWTPNKKEQGYYEGLKQQLEIENAKESAVKKRVKDVKQVTADEALNLLGMTSQRKVQYVFSYHYHNGVALPTLSDVEAGYHFKAASFSGGTPTYLLQATFPPASAV